MSAILLVRLKITDLSAWTALETGRRLLDPGYTLTRLMREQLLMLEPEALARTDSLDATLPGLGDMRSRLAALPSGDWSEITTVSSEIIHAVLSGP